MYIRLTVFPRRRINDVSTELAAKVDVLKDVFMMRGRAKGTVQRIHDSSKVRQKTH